MMALSQTTGYAVMALGCLAAPDCASQRVEQIAAATGIPRPYLAKIFNDLQRHGLVVAKRGYKGGVQLARAASQITLFQIVEAVDGPDWIGDCMLGGEVCGEAHLCPTAPFWEKTRAAIIAELQRVTVEDVMRARAGAGASAPRQAPPAVRPAKRRGRPGRRQLII